MKGSPTVLWTCDRCGTQKNVLAEQEPDGWMAVTAMPMRGHASKDDYQGDWCKTCSATYLAPLPRTGDDA